MENLNPQYTAIAYFFKLSRKPSYLILKVRYVRCLFSKPKKKRKRSPMDLLYYYIFYLISLGSSESQNSVHYLLGHQLESVLFSKNKSIL